MIKKIFYVLSLFIISVEILILDYTQDLYVYIHPRYITFTVVLSTISMTVSFFTLLFLLYKFIQDIKKKKYDFKFNISYFFKQDISAFIIVFTLCSFLILFPARALSSSTFSQRSIDLNSLNLTQEEELNVSFDSLSSKYTISDWVKFLNLNPDTDFYIGKSVDVVGFIFNDEKMPSDVFLVSRFVITCCAVDVRPIGLYVQYDFKSEYKIDDWVQVKGKFDTLEINGKTDLVIVPDEINKTEIPTNPYVI